MKIVDITPETDSHYFCCLEEWSDEIKEAGDYKKTWYEKMKTRGLKVKYALDENGVIGGMIQYLPIEHSMYQGNNLYVVLCIWVHGHKQGRGDYRKRGMGKALLKAAEDDVREMGAYGMVTWGISIPVFMRASWFRKQGYKTVEKNGIMRLLWKPFKDGAMPPKLTKRIKNPEKGAGKVNVTIFRNGWCQNMNIACERARKAAMEFPEKTNLQIIDTIDKETEREWGISDGLFIDGKEIGTGPAPSYGKVRKIIEKRVLKLH